MIPPPSSENLPSTAAEPPQRSHPHADIYRILDANSNRCLEGLRVVEEYLRFVLEDRHLASLCKQLRHDVAQATRNWSVSRLHASRASAHDVGATIHTATESQRQDARSVAAASWKRVQQALRCLEEYCKVVDVSAARQLESLRFRTYTLELAASMEQRGQQLLDHVRLYVLLDGRASQEEFAHLAHQLLTSGVDAIQLRDKRLEDRELLQRAQSLRQWTRESGCLLVMNDRPDLALLSAADGVHVGQEELTVKDVRSIVGPDMLIGVSTHSLAQAQQAVLDGANYIGCGPTFPSRTKSFQGFPGLDLLCQVSQQIQLPTFAIGGVDATNLQQVLETGINRIALQHAIVDAADPATVLHHIRRLLDTRGN